MGDLRVLLYLHRITLDHTASLCARPRNKDLRSPRGVHIYAPTTPFRLTAAPAHRAAHVTHRGTADARHISLKS